MSSLISDLKKAEKILSEYSGGYSGKHSSAEEFHTDLVDRIKKLENGNENVIEDLWIWFAPTCQWDDFVGEIDLGERIFQRLNKIKNKVSR
ncbi:hypothetical protein [Roseivirga pacifica]|nr:hypothetical protein [Roseivirga pacifica]